MRFCNTMLHSFRIADNGHNISRQTDSKPRPQQIDQNAAQQRGGRNGGPTKVSVSKGEGTRQSLSTARECWARYLPSGEV